MFFLIFMRKTPIVHLPLSRSYVKMSCLIKGTYLASSSMGLCFSHLVLYLNLYIWMYMYMLVIRRVRQIYNCFYMQTLLERADRRLDADWQEFKKTTAVGSKKTPH